MGGTGADSCAILCDDKTGEFSSFEHKCALHSQMSLGGISDPALFKQIQHDSMRWAVTVDALQAHFPTAFFRLTFNDDQSIDIDTVDKGSEITGLVQARVALAISNHPVVARLASEFAGVGGGRLIPFKPVRLRS